jgi:catechol 2,3-dioxygenase-like lactoylglutathione lyase family enzyme
MTLHAIDHVNFRGSAKLLAALQAFYCDVLGLQAGPRPRLRSSGSWLYAGKDAVIHLVEVADAELSAGPNAAPTGLDHVAFRCSNREQMLERLRRLGIVHTVSEAPATAQVVVRVQDPTGLTVELLFPLSER